MTVRPFLLWPDRRLRTAASPAGPVCDDHWAIWSDMIETMDAMPGYGLAAPQIGVMLRLAVVDCSDERGRALRLADPLIVVASDETSDWDEAPPNLPGVSARVSRPARVTVAFTDAEGDRVRQDFEGLWATSVQHQIDHLDGRMFFDRLSRTKREMLLKKALKR
ncbi:peptide deformylase [Silicimonas algicola]|nr:peptide deformylase [Silicimonas algicola]AZQ69329.1 peptide deformylase [Silicimonas algicola]